MRPPRTISPKITGARIMPAGEVPLGSVVHTIHTRRLGVVTFREDSRVRVEFEAGAKILHPEVRLEVE